MQNKTALHMFLKWIWTKNNTKIFNHKKKIKEKAVRQITKFQNIIHYTVKLLNNEHIRAADLSAENINNICVGAWKSVCQIELSAIRGNGGFTMNRPRMFFNFPLKKPWCFEFDLSLQCCYK